jgi:hypothetical protein
MTQPQDKPPSRAEQAAAALAAYEAIRHGTPDPFLPLRWARLASVVRAERRVLTAFRAMLDRTLPRLRTAVVYPGGVVDPTGVFSVQPTWNDGMHDLVEIEVREAFEDGFRGAVGAWEPDAMQDTHTYLDQAYNRLVNTPDSVYSLIKREIHDAVTDGKDLDEVAEVVRRVLADADLPTWRNRAMVIARTETISAYNAGTYAGHLRQAAALGGDWEHAWLSTEDHRTRPTHVAADLHLGPPELRQRVPLGQPFIVGGFALMYPGDPAGPPQEVIQCRCTSVLLRPGEPLNTSNRHYRSQP